MKRRRSQALGVAAGLGMGATLFAFMASLGLVTLFRLVPELYLSFKIAGGLYLCYLACKMWRSSTESDPKEADVVLDGGRTLRAVMSGLTTQLCNPKTAIVFSSVFAAMLPAQVPDYTTAVITSAVFVVNFSWYALVALLLSTPRALQGYLRFRTLINRVVGSLMGLMGLRFIASSSQAA